MSAQSDSNQASGASGDPQCSPWWNRVIVRLMYSSSSSVLWTVWTDTTDRLLANGFRLFGVGTRCGGRRRRCGMWWPSLGLNRRRGGKLGRATVILGRNVGFSTSHPRMGMEHAPGTVGSRRLEQNPGLHTGFSTAVLHRLWIFLGKNDGPVTSDDSWLRLDPGGEVGDLVEQAASLSHQLADFPVGVHHGGVVPPTEGLADLRQ